MIKIYYKPTCSTCRSAISLINDKTDEDYELIDYLKDIPTEKEIRKILKMLGVKAEELVRKKEKLYKEKYEGKKISNAEWIKILHKNPILIERPVIVKNGHAIIGRPVEKVLKFV